MNSKNKTVDAIIPVYRPGSEFWELLERLHDQSKPLNRILLMNTGEAPWKEEIKKISALRGLSACEGRI